MDALYYKIMDCIYVLLYGSEWEDIVILLTKKEAIRESIKHPRLRVEVFSKNTTSGYIPTYNFYENGQLYKNVN